MRWNALSNLIVLFGLIFVLGIMIFSIWQHEQVHLKINEYAGIKSETIFELKGGLPVVGVIKTSEPTREIKTFEALHLQNEIINYNLTTPLLGIMVLMFGGFLYIGEKVNKHE